jgi:hypothetical protein
MPTRDEYQRRLLVISAVGRTDIRCIRYARHAAVEVDPFQDRLFERVAGRPRIASKDGACGAQRRSTNIFGCEIARQGGARRSVHADERRRDDDFRPRIAGEISDRRISQTGTRPGLTRACDTGCSDDGKDGENDHQHGPERCRIWPGSHQKSSGLCHRHLATGVLGEIAHRNTQTGRTRPSLAILS